MGQLPQVRGQVQVGEPTFANVVSFCGVLYFSTPRFVPPAFRLPPVSNCALSQMPEDLADLDPDTQQFHVKMRAAYLMALGTALVLVFSGMPCGSRTNVCVRHPCITRNRLQIEEENVSAVCWTNLSGRTW